MHDKKIDKMNLLKSQNHIFDSQNNIELKHYLILIITIDQWYYSHNFHGFLNNFLVVNNPLETNFLSFLGLTKNIKRTLKEHSKKWVVVGSFAHRSTLIFYRHFDKNPHRFFYFQKKLKLWELFSRNILRMWYQKWNKCSNFFSFTFSLAPSVGRSSDFEHNFVDMKIEIKIKIKKGN